MFEAHSKNSKGDIYFNIPIGFLYDSQEIGICYLGAFWAFDYIAYRLSNCYLLDIFEEWQAGHWILSTGNPLNLFPQFLHVHSDSSTSLKRFILYSSLTLLIYYAHFFHNRSFLRPVSLFSWDIQRMTVWHLRLPVFYLLSNTCDPVKIREILSNRAY